MERLRVTVFPVLATAICLLFLAFPSGARAQEGQPLKLKFSSHAMGSAWYAYAGIIVEMIRPVLPKGSTIDVLPYGGGYSGMHLISKGDADLGLGSTSPNSWAFNGKVVFDKRLDNLRALVGGLDEYFLTFIVRKKLNISSLDQLLQTKNLRWMTLPEGSGGKLGAEHILAEYNQSWDKIKAGGGRVEHTDFSTIQQAFNDGRGDVFVHIITQGHPTVKEMTTLNELVFLPLPEKIVKDMAGKYDWMPTVLPANSFRGQTEDIPTFGVCTGISTTGKFPEDLAYKVTKTVIENAYKLRKAHAGLAQFDPKQAWKREINGLPLHPGAERYYRESDLMQ